MKEFTADRLRVFVLPSRKEMGEKAAADIVAAVKQLLKTRAEINMIFAAAPSQNEVLHALAESDVAWNRVNAFHMDEYIGLPKNAPQGFGNFLTQQLFGLVPFRSVQLIDSAATDAEAECRRYAALLQAYPADIIVMGIGENGHIAFNDPPVADFSDPLTVKPVALDPICRQQQVNDGCFASLQQVPTHAITLTCPVFLNAPRLFCIVPAPTKAEAVLRTVHGAVNESCPASLLRRHPNAALYLEPASAALL